MGARGAGEASGDGEAEALAGRVGVARERARRHYRRLGPEWRVAFLARVKANLERDYRLTQELAENTGQPWTSDEDGYIVTHPELPARELALDLGRTLGAVYVRRRTLRRRRAARGLGRETGPGDGG